MPNSKGVGVVKMRQEETENHGTANKGAKCNEEISFQYITVCTSVVAHTRS